MLAAFKSVLLIRMPFFSAWLSILVFLLPGTVMAEWQYDDVSLTAQTPQSVAELAQTISRLPEQSVMTLSDRKKVSQLMQQTLDKQQQTVDEFAGLLGHYQQQSDALNWFNLQQSYLALNSLSDSKQRLLALSDVYTRSVLTGFSSEGLAQARLELRQAHLMLHYQRYWQSRQLHQLWQNTKRAPTLVLWAFVKMMLVFAVLIWWLNHSQPLIKLFWRTYLQNKQSPALWARLVWYVSKANRSIAWLIGLNIALLILNTFDSLQAVVYLQWIINWILGARVVISLTSEFFYRTRRTSDEQLLSLRKTTIRLVVWTVAFCGLVMQFSRLLFAKSTLYGWVTDLLTIIALLVTTTAILLWHKRIFAALDKLEDKPRRIEWAKTNQHNWVLRLPATVLAAIWISLDALQRQLVAVLSNYPFFSQALAYLFRVEDTKHNKGRHNEQNYARVKGDETFDYILPGCMESPLVEDYAADEYRHLSRYLLSDSPAICVVSGERGIGVTTLLHRLLNKVSNARPLYLNCPYSGLTELLAQLAVHLGLDQDASDVQILAALRQSQHSYLIALDNAQRLVKPTVGGLNALIHLTNLLRRSKQNHRVVMAIEKSNWRFVDRARGERLLFDCVCILPRWNETQLGALLDSRINSQKQPQLSFEGLLVPRQWGDEEHSDEERARLGFYRLLLHYSDGNPTVALRFFRRSLHRHKETQQVVVRLFHTPDAQDLECMPKPMLAVLRSIVQLEVASPDELSECTQLTVPEVIGIMRYFESRGYLEWAEEKTRISDHWYRTITNVLDRQHLLVK